MIQMEFHSGGVWSGGRISVTMIRPSMERSLQGVGSASIFMSDVGYFDTMVLWAGGGQRLGSAPWCSEAK